MTFTKDETEKVESYLREKFGHNGLQVRGRGKMDDSVEVLIDGEFLGVLYKNEDEGEVSYDLNMSILAMDLDL